MVGMEPEMVFPRARDIAAAGAEFGIAIVDGYECIDVEQTRRPMKLQRHFLPAWGAQILGQLLCLTLQAYIQIQSVR